MCGIFGLFGERESQGLAREVLAALQHRGPDGDGVAWFDHGFLAHTRLSIIDLSPLGKQPMSNPDGTVWITYNGEIYNYVELRDELAGYPFRTRTDTEVILAAYERWGLGCLQRLRGMFAFGLWDATCRRLVCATDRFSIKPLYYWRDARRFIFSSEVKPMALAGVRLRPNDQMLYEYLTFGVVNHREETFFDGITQLRPGTYLTLQDGHLTVQPYWDLDHIESPDRASQGSVHVEEAVEARLIEAIRLHLRGDVEIGLSLSSGLDSNVLRALILHATGQPQPLRCFTYSFPGTPYDEWEKIRSVRTHEPRCAYQAVALEPESLFQDLQSLIEVMEEPVGGLGICGYWKNAKLAADHGVKVLLDGQGADEIFAGYRYYYDLKIRQLWEQGDRHAAHRELAQLFQAHGETAKEFPAWLATHSAPSLIMAPDATALTSEYVDPSFAARMRPDPPQFPAPFSCAVKNAMHRDLMWLKIPKLLRFQDRCAMAWGVEVRVPYLDHVLVETLFAVPTSTLLAGGLTKALLRTIGRRHLPETLLEVPKLYVSAPQREWVKTALKEPIEALIHESLLAQHGYVVKAQLVQQFRDYIASPELGNSFFAWKFINLELWYRAYCARGVAAAPEPLTGRRDSSLVEGDRCGTPQ